MVLKIVNNVFCLSLIWFVIIWVKIYDPVVWIILF